MVDIVDRSGSTLRQALKTEAHIHGWLHKTVIGYLRQDDKWGLVRQSSDRQDAGQLVAPVGGHVQAGESEVDALLRESDEEIGTRNISYTEIGRAIFHRQVIGRDENHLFVVYEISTRDPIILGDEAESIELFTLDELKLGLEKHPDHFGDSYYFLLEKFYPDTLPATWEPRWNNE